MAFRFLLLMLVASQQAWGNIGGSDLQNFNPTTNGLGFITVHPSATLEPGQLNLGSFLTFTTNSLPYSTLSPISNNQDFTNPNDLLFNSQIHFGVGLMQGWDIGASAGFINSQDITDDIFLFKYGDTGINEFRINSKVRLINHDGIGFAVIASADFEQTKSNPFVGDDPGPTLNGEAALDYQITPDILWAVNLGYRMRLRGTPIPNRGVVPMEDQILYSTALSYLTDNSGSALIGELYGSMPIEYVSIPTDRDLSNLEVLAGYRYRGFENFDIHGGLGTEVYHGLGTPDFRAYLGLNWRFGLFQTESKPVNNPRPVVTPSLRSAPLTETAEDSDGDGVPDSVDECPGTWTQKKVDSRGCIDNSRPLEDFED